MEFTLDDVFILDVYVVFVVVDWFVFKFEIGLDGKLVLDGKLGFDEKLVFDW